MKHHDLRRNNFRSVIDRVIKSSTPQLLPALVRQPISIPKRRPNIISVAGIRSLFLLRASKNPPIHHRTISNHLLNARIKRRKNSRRPAKTPPNHKHFIQRNAKSPSKRQLSKLFRKSANDVQNVQVRRSSQKLPATLPGSSIPRIKHPISLRGKKFSQWLLARNRRHPITKNNRPSNLPSASRRQEFRNNIACESCPEHIGFAVPFYGIVIPSEAKDLLLAARFRPFATLRRLLIHPQIPSRHPLPRILLLNLLHQIRLRQFLQRLVINDQQLRPSPPGNLSQLHRRSMKRPKIFLPVCVLQLFPMRIENFMQQHIAPIASLHHLIRRRSITRKNNLPVVSLQRIPISLFPYPMLHLKRSNRNVRVAIHHSRLNLMHIHLVSRSVSLLQSPPPNPHILRPRLLDMRSHIL